MTDLTGVLIEAAAERETSDPEVAYLLRWAEARIKHLETKLQEQRSKPC